MLSGTEIVSVMMKLYIKLELPLCAFASLLLSDNSEKERQVSQQAFWLIFYNFHFYLPTCKSVLNIQYIHVHVVRLLYILLNFYWFFFKNLFQLICFIPTLYLIIDTKSININIYFFIWHLGDLRATQTRLTERQ